ncbi:hypothetical protein FACS189413_06810 [Bacteroidia bacterium]|nr:hypothetical protein FACS189413_06810 [Bacteroidia bacterium]
MKKTVLSGVMFLFGLCVATTAQTDKSEKYLRPSVTNIYINRGEALSKPLIEQFETNGISDKFNNNRVTKNVVSIRKGEPVSETKLAGLLQAQITKEIAKIWFPFDSDEGEYSLDVVFERGINAATYQDVQTAGATMRREAMLRDAGRLLINRSYIVVYDVFNIRPTTARAAKGYIANCDVYLYKLAWNNELYYTLFSDENIKNPDAINHLTFPVAHVASLVGKSSLRNAEVSEPDSWSDQTILNDFAKMLTQTADMYLSQINPDFKVGTTLYAISPLRARIGTKEGLSVDQRYFVYENVQTEAGSVEQKRRGAIRVRRVGNNWGKASDKSEMSRFYQISGGKLDAGMELKQATDQGIGLSFYGGTDISALLEFNIGMWASKHGLGSTNFPYGTKVYVKYSIPLQAMITQIEHTDGTTEKIRSLGFLGGGLSKDLCFARCLALTPYVGFTGMLAFEKLQPALTSVNKLRFGVEAGTNLTLALSPSFSLIGNVNFNSVKYSYYSQSYSAGCGIRIQF